MSRRRDSSVINSAEYVTIGELARISEVRYSTLKFYSEEGLLPFVQNDTGLTRRYKRVGALLRLEDICKLRKKGMSIDDIKRILSEKNHKNGE